MHHLSGNKVMQGRHARQNRHARITEEELTEELNDQVMSMSQKKRGSIQQ
jgi:hypothetical protein